MGNTNTFSSAPWTGATHGDIVSKVTYNGTNWTARAIGGNVGDTSRFSVLKLLRFQNHGLIVNQKINYL